MAEAVTGINTYSRISVKSFGMGVSEELRRMGLKRAFGPETHPIYLGLTFVLLLPWALEAARRARAPGGQGWWQALPWLVGGGVVATVSRGPALAGLLTVAAGTFFRRRR